MNSKTTPKDFFLHAGAAIALIFSTIALIDLFFEIINKVFPDSLDSYWSASSIVWPVSILIVLVPVLYVIEWFIFRDIVEMPAKKEIWVRRWRIYTTLFLTALTLAGDLIVLINVYLNGEVTERFIWKVLTVFIVAGIIFAYYILSRIGSVKGPVKTWRIVLASVGGVVVIAALVTGFIIVGSPAQQRAIRFDEQRVNDLSNLQYQVINYWQENAALPVSLQVLNDPTSGFTVPTDPETDSQYQYSAEGSTTFRLCATFNRSSVSDGISLPGDSQAIWYHVAGHACFDRTINPKEYPPYPSATTGRN